MYLHVENGVEELWCVPATQGHYGPNDVANDLSKLGLNAHVTNPSESLQAQAYMHTGCLRCINKTPRFMSSQFHLVPAVWPVRHCKAVREDSVCLE